MMNKYAAQSENAPRYILDDEYNCWELIPRQDQRDNVYKIIDNMYWTKGFVVGTPINSSPANVFICPINSYKVAAKLRMLYFRSSVEQIELYHLAAQLDAMHEFMRELSTSVDRFN